ncbi:methionine gamma-lyase [Edwardsiella piscicida]|nr:methionine gamma-lyase [Edwardsiella piscicida]
MTPQLTKAASLWRGSLCVLKTLGAACGLSREAGQGKAPAYVRRLNPHAAVEARRLVARGVDAPVATNGYRDEWLSVKQ